MSTQNAPQMQLAPPRKTFHVETLLNGHMDVLSLLHYLHEKQGTGVRDLLINMLYDLTPSEIDSILPQLLHLWVRWDEQQAVYLSEFILFQCAHSLHFTLKIMWILHAEEAHATPGSVAAHRISDMLKLAEMSHVNSEIPTAGSVGTHSNGGRAIMKRDSLIANNPNSNTTTNVPPMKRSSTQEISQPQPANPQSLNQAGRSVSGTSPAPPLLLISSLQPHFRQPSHPQPPQLPGNRYTKLVQVNIVPADIGAPLNALVSVRIEPIQERRPSAVATTTQPSPQTRPASNSRESAAHRPVADGPAHAFTSDQSWKPFNNNKISSSPTPNANYLQATRPTSQSLSNMNRSSPAQLRGSPLSHNNYIHDHFASPSSTHSNPLSASAHSSSSSPPSAHSSSSPHLLRRMPSAEDEPPVRESDFLAAAAIMSTPSPATSDGSILADAEVDVDWPAADQDIPSATTTTQPAVTKDKSSQPQETRTRTPIVLPQKYATLGKALTNRQVVTIPTAANSTAPADNAPLSVDEPILFHLLSKQVRSEYFNLQLLLFSAFHDLSEALVKVPVADRNRVLREQLMAIDRSIIRGLYLPLIPHTSTDGSTPLGLHYKILRLLPDDCWSLASRDKAPFLLHVEIAYMPVLPDGSRMTSYDPNIYTALKSNEEIMRDALSASNATAAASMTTRQIRTPSDASIAAQTTAAQIAQMKGTGVTSPPAPLSRQSSLNASTPPQPPTTSLQLTSPNESNLRANSAANVQANGLNIVADQHGRESSTAASTTLKRESSNSSSTVTEVVDQDGKVISRSHSSSSIAQLRANEDANSREVSQALKSSISTNQQPPSLPHDGKTPLVQTASDSTLHVPIAVGSHSVSLPSSPRDSRAESERALATMMAQNHRASPTTTPTPKTTPTTAPPPATSPNPSAPKNNTGAVTPPKPAPSPVTGAKPPNSARTVPAANPFRPRRSSSYLQGPSLCDSDFKQLSAAFGESFLAKKRRIRATSPFASIIPIERWDLVSVIFKGGDDLRQEVLAMQFITAFDRIFRAAKLPLFLKPYSVVITSPDSGLIETIPDAVSIDSLKKRLFPNWTCLTDFYAAYFGGIELGCIIDGQAEFLKKFPCDFGQVTYQMALRNFVESMAGYSIVCYLLQIKDRHNGNIMIDRAGHIIHIDYGFMLSNSPGGNWNWESAPFKLTQEYLDVMGGIHSDLFAYFRMLVTRGFLEARSHVDEFIVLCAIHAQTSKMPCFTGPVALASPTGVIDAMRERFALHLQSESEVEKFIDGLIDLSIDNWRSRKYDRFQKLVSGIL